MTKTRMLLGSHNLYRRQSEHRRYVFMMDFARNMKFLRQTRGFSQKELADKIGIKQSALSRFESGKNINPTSALIFDIAEILGSRISFTKALKSKRKMIS